MKKVAYLVISDLHEFLSFSSRINYQQELSIVYKEIYSLIKAYKNAGYNVCLVFLGDIFHKDYKGADTALQSYVTLDVLSALTDKMYSVVGNHEISYYSDNPFWYLVSSIEQAPSLKSLRRKVAAKGYLNKLEVVDKVRVGKCEFLFNHYGTVVKDASPNLKTFGFFHHDLANKDLVGVMKDRYNLNVYEDGTPPIVDSNCLDNYDYAFSGHNHKLYGTFIYKSDVTGFRTELRALSSLGRTNETEVNDLFLERNIPAILFEDDEFLRVEDNLFKLLSRRDCILEDKVQKAKENRKILKERKTLETLVFDENPFLDMLKQLEGKPLLHDMLTCYGKKELCYLDVEYRKKFEEVLSW